MKEIRDIPQAELDVMNVLWRKGEATIREIWIELPREPKLAYTTVSTMLTRLRAKGFVEAEEKNFRYILRPRVKKESIVRKKLDDLVGRVLGGNLAPLAEYIVEKRKLTSEQLAVLEDIVEAEEKREEAG